MESHLKNLRIFKDSGLHPIVFDTMLANLAVYLQHMNVYIESVIQYLCSETSLIYFFSVNNNVMNAL